MPAFQPGVPVWWERGRHPALPEKIFGIPDLLRWREARFCVSKYVNESLDIEMKMNETRALDAFAALSQETRLRIVRLLVAVGREGLPAGAIGEAMDGASSSRMSFHLNHLEQAGLVESRREGRSIIYSAALPALSALVEFLMRDCCQGHPEVCNPAMAALSTCCELTKGAPHA